MGSARVSRAGERVLAIANFLRAPLPVPAIEIERKVRFGATPKPARETRALPDTNAPCVNSGLCSPVKCAAISTLR